MIIFLIMCQASGQQKEETSPNRYKFRYQSKLYKGSRIQITAQLRALKNNSKFTNIPEEKQTELTSLFKTVKNQAIPQLYRKHAILFLDTLYSYEDFLDIYDNALYEVIKKLKNDMHHIDFKFERQFTHAKITLDRSNNEDPNNILKIERLKKELHSSQIKLISHRWMKKKFDNYNSIESVKNPDDLIKRFKKKEAMNAFTILMEKKTNTINSYLEIQIIDFFHKKALQEIDVDMLELNYIDKI